MPRIHFIQVQTSLHLDVVLWVVWIKKKLKYNKRYLVSIKLFGIFIKPAHQISFEIFLSDSLFNLDLKLNCVGVVLM
jgi:hypothetical protein